MTERGDIPNWPQVIASLNFTILKGKFPSIVDPPSVADKSERFASLSAL
jgi:hypothetical protein